MARRLADPYGESNYTIRLNLQPAPSFPTMKPYAEACERNRSPILEVLEVEFSAPGRVLEIGSGTGQHAVYFGAKLLHLVWHTSDLAANHRGIEAWLSESRSGKRSITTGVGCQPGGLGYRRGGCALQRQHHAYLQLAKHHRDVRWCGTCPDNRGASRPVRSVQL